MVDIRLQFSSIEGIKDRPQIYERMATFYEAEIKVDAIISYPWLLENKLGVIPHRRALVMEDPEVALLTGLYYSLPNKEKKWWKISPGGGPPGTNYGKKWKRKNRHRPREGGSYEPLVENLADPGWVGPIGGKFGIFRLSTFRKRKNFTKKKLEKKLKK